MYCLKIVYEERGHFITKLLNNFKRQEYAPAKFIMLRTLTFGWRHYPYHIIFHKYVCNAIIGFLLRNHAHFPHQFQFQKRFNQFSVCKAYPRYYQFTNHRWQIEKPLRWEINSPDFHKTVFKYLSNT